VDDGTYDVIDGSDGSANVLAHRITRTCVVHPVLCDAGIRFEPIEAEAHARMGSSQHEPSTRLLVGIPEQTREVVHWRHRPAKARDAEEVGGLADDGDDLPVAVQTRDFGEANDVRIGSDSNGEEVFEERGARLGSVGERIVERLP
jgi:hypothetical protein